MPRKKKETPVEQRLRDAALEAALVLSDIMRDGELKADLRMAAAKEILSRAKPIEKDEAAERAIKIEIAAEIEPFTV